MHFVRTEEERFENLPGYPFISHYSQVPDFEGESLRMHYVDERPVGQVSGSEPEVILCLHGQPSWSYLYRKMIPIFVAAGYRVIAPDMIGFGKSDKPVLRENYTYANHVAWIKALIENLDISRLTLVCQDWGGLIGLRVAAENPDRFARIVAANTGLPDAQFVADDQVAESSAKMRAYYETLPVHANAVEMFMGMAGDQSGMGFLHWVKFCAASKGFSPEEVLGLSLGDTLSAEEKAAYGAPFPRETYLAGARQFPSLVPIIPDNPAIGANRAAWATLANWRKPFLTAFSDSDPVTKGGEVRFQGTVPGAQGQPHIVIKGAGHFLQDQAPEALAEATINLIIANPV